MARSFAHFLTLANIAEQHHRIRRRRAYQSDPDAPPQRGSCDETFGRLIADGLTPPALGRVVEEMRRSGARFVAGILANPGVGDLSAALRAGLDGLFSRSMSPEALRRSVELVMLGENEEYEPLSRAAFYKAMLAEKVRKMEVKDPQILPQQKKKA